MDQRQRPGKEFQQNLHAKKSHGSRFSFSPSQVAERSNILAQGTTAGIGGYMREAIRLVSFGIVTYFLLLVAAAGQQTGSNAPKGAVLRMPSPATNNSPANAQQTVFYVGKVLLDTGIAPATPVPIVRICNGTSRRETYTAGDGSFSFLVGDRFRDVTPDASDDTRTFGADSQFSRGAIVPTNSNSPMSAVSACELRAELPGYTSTSIRLDPSMNNSSVGIIMLHSRIKKAEGMVTVASLEVPVKARKEFEKGSEQVEKGNLVDAEKSLRKAIDEYPKFAEAWTRLGDLEQRRKNTEAAKQDYLEAMNSDPNFPLPYLRMALIEAQASSWEQTRKLTERTISLDPVDFPLAYYYNAVAEYNLKNVPKAESSALRAEALDKQHLEPRIELLLASIYVSKDAYSAAADHYRAYIKLVPDGPLTAHVKIDLAKIEQLARSQAPTPPANQ